MFSQKVDSLSYYTFANLSAFTGLFHAVLTRHGGFSEGYWRSLNLGGSVGDDPERVRRNKRHACLALKRNPDSLVDAWQVHGADVLYAQEPRPERISPMKADIILTNRPNLTLLMRFADCVPILLYDPQKQVIGLVHAGWQGTVKKAAMVAVQAMQAEYGSHASDILAGIGPAIGPDHYPVGPEVVEQVRLAFGDSADRVLIAQNGKVHFDLWTANEVILQQAGVYQIEQSLICTACTTHDFFSHRAEKGKTGRFGVMIGLQE